MKIVYTLMKHISALGMIFFTASLIVLITDLENLSTLPTRTWLTQVALIIAFFIINKWSNKKLVNEFQDKVE